MRHVSFIAAIALLTTVACQPRDRDDYDDGTPGVSEAPAQGAAEADREDVAEFVRTASVAELAEVRLGELASTRASNAQVKQFAKEMVATHRKSLSDLQQAVGSTTPPDTALDTDHLETYHRLSDLKGAAFDRAYIEAMVDEHEKAEDAIERWADDDTDLRPGTAGEGNTGVEQWANTTLPVVRQHLERAREIQDALGGGKVTDRIDNPPDVRVPDRDDTPDQDPDPEDRAPSPTRP